MQIKKILMLTIPLIFIISCYQQPENEAEGSVSVILKSDIMRDAPAGYDGELTLALYPAGSLDSLVNQSTSEISYLGDFPNPLMANPSVPFIGRSGQLSLLKVPVNRQLSMLVEHNGILYAGNPSGPYYLSYAAVSAPFTVAEGETIEVPITLVPTKYGSILVSKHTSFIGTDNIDRFKAYEPSAFAAYVNIDNPSTGMLTFNSDPGEIDSGLGSTGGGSTISFLEAILPGKRMRILVTDEITTDNTTVGVTDTFEVQPGRTLSVPITYYYHSGC